MTGQKSSFTLPNRRWQVDLTKLTDVELVEFSLLTLKMSAGSDSALYPIRNEWKARGDDRRLAAYWEVSNQREAVRRKEAGL